MIFFWSLLFNCLQYSLIFEVNASNIVREKDLINRTMHNYHVNTELITLFATFDTFCLFRIIIILQYSARRYFFSFLGCLAPSPTISDCCKHLNNND